MKDGIHKCEHCAYDLSMADYALGFDKHGWCNYRIVISDKSGETDLLYKKINRHGKCPYFKKKWWKFWIKDDAVYAEHEYLEHEKFDKEQESKKRKDEFRKKQAEFDKQWKESDAYKRLQETRRKLKASIDETLLKNKKE